MSLRKLIFLAAVALAACGEAANAPRPAAAAAPKPKAAAEPTAAQSEAPEFEYSYSPVGKRDPFRSVLDDLPQASTAGQAGSDCGPLCKWEIEQLKLVAVITGVSNPIGMVEDPSGKGHVVRRGSFIGKRNGKVTQIRAGEVVVTEIFKDQMGKPHVNPVYIKLPAEKSSGGQEEMNLLGPEVAE